MEYNFRDIESKWQRYWDEAQTYRVENDPSKPKYYVLDMFPYPSGAGLHVGHPLGYIASDIFSRYKRMKGFNVLHPMGFDSFGLPAEQYAIQTGQHPAITTERNIETYIRQLKQIGFSYDWSREVRTADPRYYRWTQWIFQQLFQHYYDRDADKALPISHLTEKFSQAGSAAVNAVADEDAPTFSAVQWAALSEREQYEITLKYRLTYLADAVVNWCPALGTVLANDEVKDGVSERGGYPVEQKLMRQWMMRITAYADRLLSGLDTIDWPESLKEQQRNWIGRSQGASVRFDVDGHSLEIEVFTTRLDTIFGVSFMVLAPEHEWAGKLTTPDQRESVEAYVDAAKRRSERDRMTEVKTVSGVFTGSFCLNPFNGEKVPIYLADYVLAGYGTGAVMGVPSGDQRDWAFATHFGLPIVPILDAQQGIDQGADHTKEGRYIHSDFINGMTYEQATPLLIAKLEEWGKGRGKIQYRMRNAVFSRQRYWGEPVPVYFKEGGDGHPLPYLIDEKDLPLELPPVDKYLPTETGEPPLGRAENWKYNSSHPPLQGEVPQAEGYEYELSTMPGWAGSSWYWYRYMDPENDQEFASKEAIDYWRDVDLYLGGSEHATGHLLYSRFWNKFLKDIGRVSEEEFAKKLVNQGMIQGVSQLAWQLKFETYKRRNRNLLIPTIGHVFEISNAVEAVLYSNDVLDYIKAHYPEFDFFQTPIPIEYVHDNILNVDQYLGHNSHYTYGIVFVTRGGVSFSRHFTPTNHPQESVLFETVPTVEKMSKSKYNVVNPDTIVEKYGADTLRLYEMFLGPLTDSKPWSTNGITGTFGFLRKFWRLFFTEEPNAPSHGKLLVNDEPPMPEELKALHKAIRKVGEDIEALSFNTSVPAFMVLANELTALKCHKRAILSDFVLILAPFAPHITEELWAALGNESGTVTSQAFPTFNPAYLVESSIEYPVQINGKVRATLTFPLDTIPADIEREVLANETVQKWLEGKTPKKVVVVPKRIVNVVV